MPDSGEVKMAEVVACASGYFAQAGKYKGPIYCIHEPAERDRDQLNAAASLLVKEAVRKALDDAALFVGSNWTKIMVTEECPVIAFENGIRALAPKGE